MKMQISAGKHYAIAAVSFNGILLCVLSILLACFWTYNGSSEFKCKDETRSVINATGVDVALYENVGRYCFKGIKAAECLERGYANKTGTNNVTYCCPTLKNYTSDILSEAFINRLKPDLSKASVLNVVNKYTSRLRNSPDTLQIRPAAHLGILQNGNTTGPDSEAPRVQWEKSGERSFVAGGLIHGGDRLRVTTAGYYYVYTGLQFSVDPRTVDTGAIVAYLYRHLNGTEESRRKLMTSRESSCKMTRGDVAGPVSMHMAGIYLLREGDEISVRTGTQSLLNRDPATTYMGMHMV